MLRAIIADALAAEHAKSWENRLNDAANAAVLPDSTSHPDQPATLVGLISLWPVSDMTPGSGLIFQL